MLGKLIKYEWKATVKLMLVTYGALALATIMGSLSLYQLNYADEQGMQTFAVWIVLLCVYFFAVVGIYVGDFIYLCAHYHKTMYSAQGYLTHTLPVSSAAVFGAKTLTAYIWMLISSFVSMLSVLIVLQVSTRGAFGRAVSIDNWELISRHINEDTGLSAGVFLFSVIINLLLSLLIILLHIYASMAIGQLFNTRRAAFSILAAFCLYMLQEALGLILLAVSQFSLLYNTASRMEAARLLYRVLFGGTALNIVFAAFLYAVCLSINQKRLNLE